MGTFRIHGKSGCGKSLINLICGLIQLQKGQIKINNYPIQNINLDFYLSRLSYVSQDNFLFNDTILNNLNLMKADINKEWVIRCCKLAGAHEFIMNLPNGYQTFVGEILAYQEAKFSDLYSESIYQKRRFDDF